jgi:hypothetical protein
MLAFDQHRYKPERVDVVDSTDGAAEGPEAKISPMELIWPVLALPWSGLVFFFFFFFFGRV